MKPDELRKLLNEAGLPEDEIEKVVERLRVELAKDETKKALSISALLRLDSQLGKYIEKLEKIEEALHHIHIASEIEETLESSESHHKVTSKDSVLHWPVLISDGPVDFAEFGGTLVFYTENAATVIAAVDGEITEIERRENGSIEFCIEHGRKFGAIYKMRGSLSARHGKALSPGDKIALCEGWLEFRMTENHGQLVNALAYLPPNSNFRPVARRSEAPPSEI